MCITVIQGPEMPCHALHDHWQASAVSLHPFWLQTRYLRSLVLSTSHAATGVGSRSCWQSLSLPLNGVYDTDVRVSLFPILRGFPQDLTTKCCPGDEPPTGTTLVCKRGSRLWSRKDGPGNSAVPQGWMSGNFLNGTVISTHLESILYKFNIWKWLWGAVG